MEKGLSLHPKGPGVMTHDVMYIVVAYLKVEIGFQMAPMTFPYKYTSYNLGRFLHPVLFHVLIYK